jgi:hypothetical protein
MVSYSICLIKITFLFSVLRITFSQKIPHDKLGSIKFY